MRGMNGKRLPISMLWESEKTVTEAACSKINGSNDKDSLN